MLLLLGLHVEVGLLGGAARVEYQSVDLAPVIDHLREIGILCWLLNHSLAFSPIAVEIPLVIALLVELLSESLEAIEP